jgi:hypothetical protein
VSPGPVSAKILRFVSAATYTFRELKKAFLRRYALFSTRKPCFSKSAQFGILGPILEFPLKIRIVPALNFFLRYRKRCSPALYFVFPSNIGVLEGAICFFIVPRMLKDEFLPII